MANSILLYGNDTFVLPLEAPAIGENQQLYSGAVYIAYSGAGLPTTNPITAADYSFIFTSDGGEEPPPTYSASQFFMVF